MRSWLQIVGVVSAVATVPVSSGDRIPGFSASSIEGQQRLEREFKAIPSTEEIRKFHRVFTAEPHPAGSARNNELAYYIADAWKQQGLEDVKIHRYDVLGSFPRHVSLEMIEPVRYKASLREDAYEADPDTANPAVGTSYIAMSASGEVTAPVVYAYSGNPEDYQVLRENGIDVRGKIVLVRYSSPYSYRGFKALTAERNGAAAILIYSDPQEDGYAKGKVFPDGPWGPESHFQRGAITYDFIVPGDPLTPGWASVEGARRLPIEQARSVPRIMALALSWRDAKPLLEQMDGPRAPDGWQGALPIEYRLGGKRVKAHLKIDMDTSVRANLVTEARIRGSELPDEWIVTGNHRDAWVFGGVDPSSGTATMMEVTRALGQLLEKGSRPRRTLIFCSWDGEEVALTGSTEWGEQFAGELKSKAVAYINVDSAVSGAEFAPSAVASLVPALLETAKAVRDPASGESLYEARKASVAQKPRMDATALAHTSGHDLDLVETRIGSGSDHTVFLLHLGIPTVGLAFVGPYGVYHSMYDNYYWMSRFGDPGYRYHKAMAETWGVLTLRIANAEILPYDFAVYGADIRSFVLDLQERHSDVARNLPLERLLQAVARFETSGRNARAAVETLLASDELAELASINARLIQIERNWLNPEGLPGRPWFRHMLFGARYTYAHLQLPAVTEAVESDNWEHARRHVALLEKALATNAALLDSVAATGRTPRPVKEDK
jgi:N-acetylated-alpha-linked acidic dipeptidase